MTSLVEKDRPDARELGDWTRKGPLPDIGGQRRVSERGGFGDRGGDRAGFGSRNFDNVSEAGSDRGSRRPAYEQGDGKVRDFGNWERKGPLTPSLPTGPAARSMDRPISHDGPRDRRNSPAWGEGRSQEGSRPPRREFVERPVSDRAPTAPEVDNQWRTKMRPDPPAVPVINSPTPSSRELSTPPSPAAAPAPATRPKLNLQKRTISESEPAAAPKSANMDTKISPFGAAKPIDTFAKEREIEEKREAATRQKKEAEDKAREEKKLTEDKAREEKQIAKEAEKTEKTEKAEKVPVSKEKPNKPNGQEKEKENGIQAPQSGKNYEILRRTVDGDASTADEELETGDENGIITEDKSIKPKEIVRDIPTKKADGGLTTNGVESQQVDASADTSADALEDDGWSTVSKPRNNRRAGNQAARAIAS